MLLFRKVFLALVLVLFAGLMSGCALIAAGAITATSENEAGKLDTVEVGEVKVKPGVDIPLVKTAKVSSAIFQKDMVTHDTSPRPSDNKVNTVITEEMRRTLNLSANNSSLIVAHLKTLYYDGINAWGFSYYYYGSVTERDTLSYVQQLGVRKIVNAHFVLEQGSNTLLEVHGLWVSGSQGDEIAGARQLAKEMANAVLKKLNSPASRSATAEAKKD